MELTTQILAVLFIVLATSVVVPFTLFMIVRFIDLLSSRRRSKKTLEAAHTIKNILDLTTKLPTKTTVWVDKEWNDPIEGTIERVYYSVNMDYHSVEVDQPDVKVRYKDGEFCNSYSTMSVPISDVYLTEEDFYAGKPIMPYERHSLKIDIT